MSKLRVARGRFAAEEDAVLSEAVMNAQGATDPMTQDERTVYDADEFLGSVMMDGLLLTFSNKGLERIRDMGVALERIGADTERALLGEALLLWQEHGDAGEALKAAVDALDQRFFEAASAGNNVDVRTKRYVREHLDSFIVLEEPCRYDPTTS